MLKPEVRETTLEEAQKLEPNKIKYMTFLDGSVAIFNSDTEDERNQKMPEQIKLNNNDINKEIKERNEENEQYIQNNNNSNNIYNENFNNNIISNNYKVSNEEQNFEIEINHNNINEDNNMNYMTYNYENANKNQYEETEEKENEIPTIVKVIKANDNNIKYNVLPQQEFNNQNFYESNPPPQIESQILSENNNFQIKNKISYENKDELNQEIKPKDKENHILYNTNNNNNSLKKDNLKDSGLVKNNNYKILYKNENFLNNNIKKEKTTFIEDKNIENNNNIKKEKTIFIEDKSVENINNNYSTKMNQELKEEILNKGYFSNVNTKVINAIPIENYEQNQKYINAINNIQKNQQMNSETSKTKVFIATDTNSSNIIPKQKEGNYQKLPEIEDNIQNLNKNQNLIPIKLNQINYSGQDIENILLQKHNNQQFENQTQNYNDSNNILYQKVGYGNDDNIQKQLKKKRKKRIYVRMKKPIIQQHFDIQILKNIDQEGISQKYQQYQEQINKYQDENVNQFLKINQNQNILKQNQILNQNQMLNINQNRNDFIEDTQSSNNDIHEKKVPPVINKYQNPNTFNSPFYLIQNEVRCNCNIPYKQYNPIISENASTLHSYSNEDSNFKSKNPCNQKQTIINITPMRTMKQSNSPNREYSYNTYDKRYLINERNINYRTLTPNNNKSKQNEIENGNNDEYYYNDYSNERRRNNKYIHIYENREEMNENSNSYEDYNRGQRIARDDY